MPATLTQLVRVHSRLAEEAIRFLEHVAEATDATPWEFGGKKMRSSSAFVEPVVLTWREQGSEGDEAGGSEGNVGGAAKVLSPTDVLFMKQHERERQVGKNEEQRWSLALQNGGRLRRVVIGEPGSGKTCATRHTAAELARESAKALEEHTAEVWEVSFPLWITAAHLLAQPEGLDVSEAVLGALEKQPGLASALTPFLRSWLLTRVRREKAFIVLDALDELASTNGDAAERLAQRLGELGDSDGSLAVTCRTLPWERLKTLVPWQDARHTAELKPLDNRRQRGYAERFFTFLGKPALADEMDERLGRSLSLREHCRTQLILTFACGLLADGKLSAGSTIVNLYNQVISSLLEGRWRDRGTLPEWCGDEDERAEVQAFIATVAWKLFQDAPATNRFDLAAWKRAYDFATERSGALFLVQLQLRKDLGRLGLLLDGGTDEHGKKCWSFGHRTVLEFLAAVGLGEDKEKLNWLLREQKPIEDNPFWFQPEWLPTLMFLAAIMEDATPLIEAVEIPPLIDGKPAPEDDFFRQMFGLKCHFAQAVPTTPESVLARLSADWIRGLMTVTGRNSLVSGWMANYWMVYGKAVRETRYRPKQDWVGILRDMGSRLVFKPPGPKADHGSKNAGECPDLQAIVATALDLMESSGRLEPVLGWLEDAEKFFDGDSHDERCCPFVRALGNTHDVRVIQPLLEWLKHDYNGSVRMEIFEVLGLETEMDAKPALLRLLYPKSRNSRSRIAKALNVAENDRVVDALIAVQSAKERRVTGRMDDAEALWEISQREKCFIPPLA